MRGSDKIPKIHFPQSRFVDDIKIYFKKCFRYKMIIKASKM